MPYTKGLPHLLNAHQLRLSHPESEGSEYTRGHSGDSSV